MDDPVFYNLVVAHASGELRTYDLYSKANDRLFLATWWWRGFVAAWWRLMSMLGTCEFRL